MELQQAFKSASENVMKLSRRPSNQELLSLYALYKQATVGDVQGKRPGMLDMKGRAKYDAWSEIKGLPKEEAMQKYIELVSELEANQA